jgi:protein-S-isoprenylcysteine O-methyltransferase Ste14
MIIWVWSVYLILTRIPQKELITNGPYALMKHPLYTGVALLVLPWLGFLCNSWLGSVIGGIVYIGCRIYAPEEEKVIARIFGISWNDYAERVLIPWL